MFKHHLELTVSLVFVVLCCGCTSPATENPVSLTATPLPASTITPSQPSPTPTHSPTNTSTPTLPLTGPYLGQEPPEMEPKIFAPGIVSDPDSLEFSGAFSTDGSEYYFYRISGNSQSRLLFSKIIDGVWAEPKEPDFSSGYGAFEPYIGFDNERLYFAWTKPVPSGSSGLPGYFFVERTQDGWSEPTFAGQGMFISSSRDGQFYITDMSSRNIDGKTYLAKLTISDGVFTSYERLPIQAHWGDQAHPCIAPDGSYILFDVESGYHLYISFKNADGTWGEAIDLTQHGFDLMAGGAYISPDGKYLFFALNRDIWWVDIRVVENLRPQEGK
jgi:Tol biopolymer transport system component